MKRNNNTKKKKNDGPHRRPRPRAQASEAAVGRDLRKLATSHSKSMASKCRKFCAAVSDPADRTMQQPVLDEAHLANVESMGIVRVRKRFSLSSVLNTPTATDHIMWVVANPVAISTAGAAVEYTKVYTSGTIHPSTVPAQSLTLGGSTGWTSSFIQAPWSNADLDDASWSVAYVSSELTVTNTTPQISRGGYFSGLSLDYLASAEYLDGSNIMTAEYMDSLQDTVVCSGEGSISVSHIASVVQTRTARAPTGTVSLLNCPLMVKWQGGIPTDALLTQSFFVEINALFYVWGKDAHPSQQPIRMPGLWSCLRGAQDSDRYTPVVSAPPDELQERKKKQTNTLTQIAGNLMKEHAGEIVSFGLTALGTLL